MKKSIPSLSYLFQSLYLLQGIPLGPQDIPTLTEPLTMSMKFPPVLRWSGLHSPSHPAGHSGCLNNP